MTILDPEQMGNIGAEAISRAFPDWFPFADHKTQYIYTCSILVSAVEVLRKLVGDEVAKEFVQGALESFDEPALFEKEG